MSADNVIVVGKFPRSNHSKNKYIYKVAETGYSGLIELTDPVNNDAERKYQDACIISTFVVQHPQDFTNYEDAWLFAGKLQEDMLDDGEILEYGVTDLTFSRPFPKYMGLIEAEDFIKDVHEKKNEAYWKNRTFVPDNIYSIWHKDKKNTEAMQAEEDANLFKDNGGDPITQEILNKAAKNAQYHTTGPEDVTEDMEKMVKNTTSYFDIPQDDFADLIKDLEEIREEETKEDKYAFQNELFDEQYEQYTKQQTIAAKLETEKGREQLAKEMVPAILKSLDYHWQEQQRLGMTTEQYLKYFDKNCKQKDNIIKVGQFYITENGKVIFIIKAFDDGWHEYIDLNTFDFGSISGNYSVLNITDIAMINKYKADLQQSFRNKSEEYNKYLQMKNVLFDK